MSEPVELFGVVFKNASCVLLARVVGPDNSTPIVQSDIASAKYTVYLIDPHDADDDTPVEGHTDVALTVSAVIFNDLQTDDLWGETDDAGYNFKLVLDVSAKQAFSAAGREYRIVVSLTPNSGQVIPVRFRVSAI